RDVPTWLNGIPKICQCCVQGKDARRRVEKRRCCAVGSCCHSAPSAQTIGDMRKVLRSALSWAIVEELIARNSAASVKLPTARLRMRKSWTSDEARRLLESARADGDAF